MFVFLVIVHILVGLILILSVLLQSGKSGDLASAFGGASSQTAFGAQGAISFLSKVTTFAAITFMVTSLGLSIISSGGQGSVLDDVDLPTAGQPQTPAEAAPQPQAGDEGTTPSDPPDGEGEPGSQGSTSGSGSENQ